MDILERRGYYRVMVFIQFPPGLRERVGLAGMQLMIFLVSAWIQKVLDRALYSAAWLVAGPRGWQARSAFQALLSGTHLSRAGADWAQTLGPNHRLADEFVSSHPAGLFCYWPTDDCFKTSLVMTMRYRSGWDWSRYLEDWSYFNLGIGYVAHFPIHIKFYTCKVLKYLDFLLGYSLAAPPS